MSLNKDNTPTPKLRLPNTNTKGGVRILFLVIIYVIALVIVGLGDLVASGFDVSIIGTSTWWSGVFTTLGVNALVLLGTIMHDLSKALDEDSNIKAKAKEVEQVVDSSIDPNTFDPFMVDFNINRKTRQYKKAINTKIAKLERKATSEDLEDWVLSQREKREPEREFGRKKLVLLKQLDPEFIADRIIYMDINYKPIEKSFVTNGYQSRNNDDELYKVESGAWKMIRELSPRFVITIAWLVVANSIFVEVLEDADWRVVAVKIGLKLLPIAMQIYGAKGYVKSYIQTKIMVDFRTRIEIITLYLASLNKKVEVENNG